MAHFQINRAWLDEVRASPEVEALVVDAGEAALGRARAGAARIAETGDFAEHMSGDLHHSRKGVPWYRVANDDPGALSIEFGTAHEPAHRVLGKALEG